MLTPKTNNLRTDQRGLVSFFVTIIIMILITLVVLSFAAITRREQRQALDRQLNSQAYYAAISGINDAYNALKSNPNLLDRDYNDCNDFAGEAHLNPQISEVTSYSCLLVDPTPDELKADSIEAGKSFVVRVKSSNGQRYNKLSFSWKNPNASSHSLSGCNNFEEADKFKSNYDDTCSFGVIRVEFVPFEGSRNRNQLIEDRSILFANPVNNFPGSDFLSHTINRASTSGNNQGKIIPAFCVTNPAPSCSISLTNVNASDGYLKISSIYKTSSISVQALSDNSPMELSGSQVVIDVTGKSNDVLKRVREYRPIEIGGLPFPNYALQSAESQCKLFSVTPSSVSPLASNDPCSPI